MARPDLLRFRRFDRTDLDTYAAWSEDEDTALWMPEPDEDWLSFITDADGGACAEIATTGGNGEAVAVVHYDIDGDGGISLLVTVDPKRRRQGLGRAVLEAFLKRMAERFDHADIWVSAENVAGLSLVRRLRFRPVGAPTDDGFLEFTRPLRD